MAARVVTDFDDAFPPISGASDRSFLVRSLADLDAEHAAGDLDDVDFAELRARYEAKLAALDDATDRSGPGTGPQDGRDRDQNDEGAGRRRGGRRSVVVTIVVVLAVGLGGGFAVARSSGARKPGETVTGTVPSTSAQKLAEAAQLASDGKVLDALKVYDAVLKENPRDVRALTYKGWLLRNVGVESNEPALATQGVDYLDQATELDPRFAEAWLFRGIVYLRDDDDPAKATEALKAALASDPIPEVSRAARELLAEINQTASTSSTTGP
jgi:tetratricopeptide (TPR) repeat protein